MAIRAGRARYDKLHATIKSQREDRANAQAAIDHAVDAIAEHLRERPAAAAYLGEDDDPDVSAWHRALGKLEEKRDVLIASRNHLSNPEPLVDEAIAYEGMTGVRGTRLGSRVRSYYDMEVGNTPCKPIQDPKRD